MRVERLKAFISLDIALFGVTLSVHLCCRVAMVSLSKPTMLYLSLMSKVEYLLLASIEHGEGDFVADIIIL